MKGSSIPAKMAALLVAVAAHVAAGLAFWEDRVVVQTEATAGAASAQLGSSFRDLAVAVAPAPAVPMQQAEPVSMAAQGASAPRVEPTVTPAEPAFTRTMTAPASTAAPIIPAQTVLPAPAEQDSQMANPRQGAARPEPAEVQPARPPESVLAATDSTTPYGSLRPAMRSRAFEREHAGPEQARPNKPVPRAIEQPGNSDRTARAGSETGSNQAQSKRQGSGGTQASPSGNSAVSNYPGKVMRKISRVSRPRVGSRATAVVQFSISPSGGLAGVSIARSSGSAELDRAALRVVRRAAPFPPPPPGAQRSYSIKIKGSG